MTLADLLPTFVAEVETALATAGLFELAAEVHGAEFERYTYDSSCDAAYLYVRSPRKLNIVETNIIGVRHGETITVEHPWDVCLDTDNFGRLYGIEVLQGGGINKVLSDALAR